MIKSIDNMILAFQKAESEADKMVIDAVRVHEEEMIELNTDDQLFDKGISGSGQPIRPKYTPFTVSIKSSKGQRTDHVTLNDTGDFYEGFRGVYGVDRFFITSDDPKTKKLISKYGKDIFGLTPEKIGQLAGIIREEFLKETRKVILQ